MIVGKVQLTGGLGKCLSLGVTRSLDIPLRHTYWVPNRCLGRWHGRRSSLPSLLGLELKDALAAIKNHIRCWAPERFL